MSSTPRRYPSLDLLRLIAISMTMLVHTPSVSGRLPGLRSLQFGLWLGVDLFMLISGWLLGGQLLRMAANGRMDPLRFYVKRWARTLPPYYAVLLLVYVIPGPQNAAKMPWRILVEHATFTQVYADHNWYRVSWSLSVEEHFYLLLPLLVLLLLRRPRLGTLIAMVVGTEVISLVSRAFTFPALEDVPFATHMRCDGLFIGLALSWIQLHRSAMWKFLGRIATALAPVGVIATVLVMASLHPAPHRWLYIGAPTVGTWTLALLFLPCVHESSSLARIRFPGLQYLGELTYAIYLTHYVIPERFIHLAGGAGTLLGASWRVALVLAASVALHHLVERPALRLRERLLDRWRARQREEAMVAEPSGS
jgi:peptidoglycan/LPS O-acetylase OafA/YrhL